VKEKQTNMPSVICEKMIVIIEVQKYQNLHRIYKK